MSTTKQRNGSTRKWRETRARMIRALPAPCGVCGTAIRSAADCDVDHVIPVQYGGTDQPSNIGLTHSWCNRGRRIKVAKPKTASTPPATTPAPRPALAEIPGLPDPDPGNHVITWSRHWHGPANPRCPHCRELRGPCPDAA